MIAIRFVTTNSLVSTAIRRAEMGFWASHCEVVLEDGRLLGAHVDGGVQARAANYDAGQWTRELFVEVPATDAQTNAAYGFLTRQIGKPYDKDAIVAMALGALDGQATIEEEDLVQPAWICSALIAAALLKADLVKSAPASIRLTTPRDMLCMLAAITTIGTPQTAGEKTMRRAGLKIETEPFDPFGAR